MHTSNGLALLAGSALLLACGDITSSSGELGRLNYSLYTDYEVPQSQLTAAHIVTGHTQRLDVVMTSQGRKDIKNPESIQHSVSPTDGVTISTALTSPGIPPSLQINVTNPGDYKISSHEGDTEVDRIGLHFDRPTSFSLLLQARAPYAKDFQSISAPTSLVEGTQITIVSAPLDSQKQRLAGMMQNTLTLTPHWIAVPGQGVVQAYEQNVWTMDGTANFYFIEPGTATLTVTDPVSKASSSAVLTITPMPHN